MPDPIRILHQADVEAVVAAKHLTLEADELPHTAYALAVAGGYVGTEVQWIASLEGAVGPAGAAGAAGAPGAPGAPGAVGPWGTFSATAVQLADVTHAINTADKVAGKQVWDTTNNIPLFADGPAVADHWYTIAGVDTITPA